MRIAIVLLVLLLTLPLAMAQTVINGSRDVRGTLTTDGLVDVGTVETFTDTDATPDVSTGVYWNTFTNTLTITDFDGSPLDGQLLVVNSKAAITYDCTTSGLDCGTTDIVTAAGDTTFWMYDGTNWDLLSYTNQADNLGVDAGAAGGDSISIDSSAVVDPDFVSTGQIDFIDTSNTVTANINDDSIVEADLNAQGTPTDEYCLTSETGGGAVFEWQACGAGSEVNDLESIATSAGDGEIFVGTGLNAGVYVAGLAACAPDEKIEYVPGSPDTFTCEAIGSLVEGDITDLTHTTDEVGTLTTGDLCVNDGSSVNCTVNTIAELETALDAEDILTATEGNAAYQPLDTELSLIAGLAETTGNVMIGVTGAWASVAQPIIDCTNCTNIPAGTVADLHDITNVTLTTPAATEALFFTGVGNASANRTIADADVPNTITIDNATTAGTTTGNAGTVTFADAAGDTTTSVALGTAATGSLAPATDAELTYNATTNALTTTTFIGALSGNATTATTATTTTGNAGTVTTADAGEDTTTFPMLATSATGSLAPATDAGLSYNGTTNALTATTFVGTVTTNANLTGEVVSVGNAATIVESFLQENGASELTGETLGTACTENQILKANATGGLDCAADADSGGAPAFSAITGATNTTAAMVVGTGASLAVSGSGTIAATTATTATTATVATTATITDNESTAEINALIFTAGGVLTGGDLGLESDGDATYTPSTGTITATEFVGGGVGLTGITASHADTITWTGTPLLETGATFTFGDASDATLTHTYANTGTNVSIAYSTAAMAVTGSLTATNLSGTNTGDEVAADLTTAGVIEIATGAETNTGTDATRAVSPDALEDWEGSAFVTTLGTITSGTWSATDVAAAAGGTGASTLSDGNFMVGNGTGAVASAKPFFSIVLETPADADNFNLFKAQYALTITDIDCLVDPAGTGESVVIDVQERDATADNPATVDATITCSNTGAADDGTLTNGTIDSGDWVSLDIGTVTGTVTQLTVTVTYTID